MRTGPYSVEFYARKYPHIDPVTRMYRDLEGRFWSRVDADGDCWQWVGPVTGWGYGEFRLRPQDGAGHRMFAHRFAWQTLIGSIPDSLQIDHLCRNKRCVNPDHLEPVDAQTNVLRGYAPTVLIHKANLPTCTHGHLWSEANTLISTRGYRQCRRCNADKAQRSYRKKKALLEGSL